jgi:flagellar motor protein MotB
MVGCVPAEQYAAMKMKADQLAAQVASDQTAINTANNRADLADRQLQNQNNGTNTQLALTTNLEQQNDELRKQNEDAQRRYNDAMALVGRSNTQMALPAPLTDELKQFAAASPDLIEFDPVHGVVKFKSDVTFPAGDATVTAAAKPVLSKFASILTGAAAGYELLVAGHTDSTPVTNKLTIQKGNFDNWYLSSHRAISVGKELIADGVDAKRLGVVGYADERPIPGGSNAQNRRVEVLILPATAHSAGSYASNGSKSHRTRPTVAAPADDAMRAGSTLNKDGPSVAPARVPTPVAPTMNK